MLVGLPLLISASSRPMSGPVPAAARMSRMFGATRVRGFMRAVFLRDGDDECRTYNTTSRGGERIGFADKIRNVTRCGRQQDRRTRQQAGRSHRHTGSPQGRVLTESSAAAIVRRALVGHRGTAPSK